MNKIFAVFVTIACVNLQAEQVACRTPEPFVDHLAPNFELPDETGVLRSLQELRGSWVVLSFSQDIFLTESYTVARLLKEVYPWLRGRNVNIVFVCDQKQQEIASYKKRNTFPFLFLNIGGTIPRGLPRSQNRTSKL
jgi:hypothetical protein